MGIGRKVASVASAVALAGMSLVALGQTAFGAAGVTATTVDEGQATTITITGCDDKTVYSGATVEIFEFADDSSENSVHKAKVATQGKPSATYSWKGAAGAYGVEVTCLAYSGENAVSHDVFLVYPTSLYIDPSSWNAGDEVTINAYGFDANESISLKMVDKSTGKVVWSKANVAKADANGNFSHDLVLFADVPAGTYLLVATGAESGLERTAEFYWGTPDDEGNGSGGNGNGSGGPKPTGPKLPSTGN